MNLSELKRLAEGAKVEEESNTRYRLAWDQYMDACDPDTILALLAAVEALEKIVNDTEDILPPFRSVGASGPVKDIARSALTELNRLMGQK